MREQQKFTELLPYLVAIVLNSGFPSVLREISAQAPWEPREVLDSSVGGTFCSSVTRCAPLCPCQRTMHQLGGELDCSFPD